MVYYRIEIVRQRLPLDIDGADGGREAGGRVTRGRRRGKAECTLSLEEAPDACRTLRTEHGKRSLFYSRGTEAWAMFGLISPNVVDASDEPGLLRECAGLANLLAGEWELARVDEVPFSGMLELIEASCLNAVVSSESSLLAEHDIDGMDDLYNRHWLNSGRCFKESVLKIAKTRPVGREELLACCGPFKSSSALEEIDRIYETRGMVRGFMGHPVHYIFDSSDLDFLDECSDALLKALHLTGRLPAKRVTSIDLPGMDIAHFRIAVTNAEGTTLRLNIGREEGARGRAPVFESCRRMGLEEGLEAFGDIFQGMSRSTLLLLSIDTRDEELCRQVRKALPRLEFVVIAPDAAEGEAARRYVECVAASDGLGPDDMLLDGIEGNRRYFLTELDAIEEEWRSERDLGAIRTAYSEVVARGVAAQAAEACSAKAELGAMVGLEGVKDVIAQYVAAHKARKAFADFGRHDTGMSMHMVFSGNPGTAKTTVARLLGRILKEEGVLEGGQMVEVGRADLVGKYVGWTAPAVKRAFERACGGVLFIDEAYSLVDDKRGLYGDEAINAIVQEMENLRDEVVVVFAGYPQEMREFVDRNPGMRSRVSHYVEFPDYGCTELVEIARKIAGDMGFALSPGAIAALESKLESLSRRSAFGNGRLVRNAIEQSIARQAVRLMSMDPSKIGRRTVLTLCKDDIVVPEAEKEECPSIGFVS